MSTSFQALVVRQAEEVVLDYGQTRDLGLNSMKFKSKSKTDLTNLIVRLKICGILMA